MSKKTKAALFSKRKLQKKFTRPKVIMIEPEGVEVHSIHISKKANKKGFHTIYDSHSNTKMFASRASIAAFTYCLNDGDHHEALRADK